MIRNYDPVRVKPFGDINAKVSGRQITLENGYTNIVYVTPEADTTFSLSYIGVSALDDVWCKVMVGNTQVSPERYITGRMHKQIFFLNGMVNVEGDGNTIVQIQIRATTPYGTTVSAEIAGGNV
jgi:hypothetical protein